MKLQEKRVLIVLNEGALGGAQRQALGLAKYLSTEKKCYVDLLLTFSNTTTSEFDDFMKECGISNIIHIENPYLFFNSDFTIKNIKRLKWSLSYLYRLRKKLKPNKYDIVIPYLNFTSKISFYLYKLLPTVKFTFWHQLGLDILVYDYFERFAALNTPCVIGNATNCFDIFKKDYILPKYKLNLLPQYLTLNKVVKNKTLLKKQFIIDENKIVIGMVAHFRSDKYQELLINVFTQLIKKYSNIHLILLGNRENDEASNNKFLSLQTLIKENKIIDSTTLLSNVDVVDVLNILDIGVLVSMIEGTPNAVMEYMLYGIPVVASNHPGCVGLLKESPFLVKNDEEIIYSKLSQLIESNDLRIQEGNKNLERIKEYDLLGYIDKLEKIIYKYIKHD